MVKQTIYISLIQYKYLTLSYLTLWSMHINLTSKNITKKAIRIIIKNIYKKKILLF